MFIKSFKAFSAAVMAVLCLTACNKSQDDVQVASSGKALISLQIGGPATKATVADTENEAKVSSVQVFVFNGEAVDGYKNAEAAEVTALSVDVTATVGTRDIWAICNAPSLASCTSRTAVLEAVSKLSDNASDSYVMGGSLESQSVQAEYSATVDVDRYAARIRIQKITRQLKSEAYKSVKMRINKIYLTSAVSNELYSFGKPDAYTWLNASFGADRAMSTDNPFVYQKLGTAYEIAQDASYSTEHAFYCYANVNSSDDTADPKTFRRTRLVVECQIDVDASGTYDEDEYYTYPISVGAVSSNTSYDIQELVITRLGNDSDGDDDADDGEDDDIDTVAATVKITVNDWTQVLVGNGGTVTI